jgi:hypothetical protein
MPSRGQKRANTENKDFWDNSSTMDARAQTIVVPMEGPRTAWPVHLGSPHTALAWLKRPGTQGSEFLQSRLSPVEVPQTWRRRPEPGIVSLSWTTSALRRAMLSGRVGRAFGGVCEGPSQLPLEPASSTAT